MESLSLYTMFEVMKENSGYDAISNFTLNAVLICYFFELSMMQ